MILIRYFVWMGSLTIRNGLLNRRCHFRIVICCSIDTVFLIRMCFAEASNFENLLALMFKWFNFEIHFFRSNRVYCTIIDGHFYNRVRILHGLHPKTQFKKWHLCHEKTFWNFVLCWISKLSSEQNIFISERGCVYGSNGYLWLYIHGCCMRLILFPTKAVHRKVLVAESRLHIPIHNRVPWCFHIVLMQTALFPIGSLVMSRNFSRICGWPPGCSEGHFLPIKWFFFADFSRTIPSLINKKWKICEE